MAVKYSSNFKQLSFNLAKQAIQMKTLRFLPTLVIAVQKVNSALAI